MIGRKIQKLGLFDLSVCEAIARLARPDDLLLDIGANCGQMTSLMSICAGPSGKVMSFEPHPVNFSLLKQNTDQWTDSAEIVIFDMALGEMPGIAQLGEPPNFEENTGLSSLVRGKSDGRTFEVNVDVLDNVLTSEQEVGLMKMDVEGFEINVLRGAHEALRSLRIRNLIYEDHDGYPSEVSKMLEEFGYTILSPQMHMLGPRLVDAGRDKQTNFLATLDMISAKAAFSGIGYACLRRR